MIKIIIKNKEEKEKSFSEFKKITFYPLNKYREKLYFIKKKQKKK